MRSLWCCLVGLMVLACPLSSSAEEMQRLRSRGAELYYLDADLRAAFAKANPQTLPETRRKALPKSTPIAFDWTGLATRRYSYTQRVTPYCWAFASVTAFEWNWAIRNGGEAPIVAVQSIIDHTKETGGAPHSYALEALLRKGSCDLKEAPYTGKPGPGKANVAMKYRAIAWGRVDSANEIPAPARIKQALLEHGTLVASVYASKAFENYRGGVFNERFQVAQNEQPVNHSVVIVGWDDRKGRGCWKVQNSWGPMWGEGGYMWIEYASNNIGSQACWIIPQSTHYQLPADANKLLTGEATPFFRWTKAVALAAPKPTFPKVTVEEALKKQGQRVEVQFAVKGFGTVQPSGHLELRSDESNSDQCLTAQLLKSELHKFPTQNEQELLKTYQGKTIRVRGSLQPMHYKSGTRLVIEVGDPSRIEIVED